MRALARSLPLRKRLAGSGETRQIVKGAGEFRFQQWEDMVAILPFVLRHEGFDTVAETE